MYYDREGNPRPPTAKEQLDSLWGRLQTTAQASRAILPNPVDQFPVNREADGAWQWEEMEGHDPMAWQKTWRW
jgi:hypothetical protein